MTLIIGCTSQGAITPTARLTLTPTAAQTAVPTLPVPTLLTPTLSLNTPTSLPTQAIQNSPMTVSGPQFNTIALGAYAALTKAVESSYKFRIKQVLMGQAAADKLAKYQVPEGLQWVIVITEEDYLHGPAGQRIQLMNEDGFRIISKGQVLANDYFRYIPVSNHINNITLLPGEMSYGYLVFAIVQDDNAPVLRYTDDQGTSFYFALTAAAPASSPLQITPLQFGVAGLGKVANPVPLGNTVAYTLNGDPLLLTIKQVERGFDVSRRLWDIAGVKQSPGYGLDYIMPYLDIIAAGQSSGAPIDFDASLFSVVSNGKTFTKPGLSCRYPCLSDIAIYQGGEAQGWLPRLTNETDPAPLLEFNNELYFSLTGTNTAQNASTPEPVPPLFPVNAIGYDTIKNVGQAGEMQQGAVVQALAFSPDDRLLASGGDDHKIHIWNVATAAEITTLAKHQAAIKYLDFSADGKWLASVSSDEEIIIWNVSDWSVYKQLQQAGSGIFGQFLPDNNLVTVNQVGLITVWDPVTGEQVKQYSTQKNVGPNCGDTSLYNFDMSPDGKTFAASLACGYGVMWDPETGARLATDYNHAIDSGAIPTISAISVSNSDGLAAYAGSFHNNVGYLVDIVDTQDHVVLGGVGTATTDIPAIAFAPNGEIIAAAVGNKVRTWWPNGYVWDGRHLIDLTAHTAQVTSIKFSSDATLLASGDYSGEIVLWKVKQ